MEDRINYFERMLADNPTGLLALANEDQKAECYEDEAQPSPLPYTRIKGC